MDQALLEALEQWLARHRSPNQPIIGTGNRDWTPRELVEAVRHQTEDGENFARFLTNSAQECGMTAAQFIQQSL